MFIDFPLQNKMEDFFNSPFADAEVKPDFLSSPIGKLLLWIGKTDPRNYGCNRIYLDDEGHLVFSADPYSQVKDLEQDIREWIPAGKDGVIVKHSICRYK